MATYQVTQTAKESAWAGGSHQHIAALCLSDGRRVGKAVAVANVRSGLGRYYTYADGQQAWVEVVDRCAQCGTDYLRTDRDTTTRNNLLELPDC